MLFISIPKSASNLLVSTIIEKHGFYDKTRAICSVLSSLSTSYEYEVLKRTHSEFVELDEAALKYIESNDNAILKCHIPPTENNQKLLHKIKKVILLRKPEDVVLTYKRDDESGVFSIKDPAFAFCVTKRGWLKKAEKTGLLQELRNFYKNWYNHTGDSLVICYKELMKDTPSIVRKIESYFKLPNKESIIFKQEHYLSKTFFNPWNIVSLCRLFWRRRYLIKRRLAPVLNIHNLFFQTMKLMLRRLIYVVLGKPYKDFYSSYMKERIKQNERGAVGGMWEEMGILQFEFLKLHGLKPYHMFFDIGCGVLRGGRHFISYLDKEKYIGCDISPEALRVAERSINEMNERSKQPVLFQNNDLKFTEINQKFDYILAQSVFTHMPKSDIEECFQHIGRLLKEDGKFFATFFEDTRERISFRQTNFYYPYKTLLLLGKKHGLSIKKVSYNHPRRQRMLCIGHS